MVRTFDITPATSAPIIFISAISIILILLMGLLAFTGYSSRNVKFEVSDQGLRINGGIYGRFIAKENITGEGVKIIDFNTSPEYKPRIKTNGISLPGYSEGWFRLNSKEKALLFVTDYSRVVYIPTDKGYSVLLSVSQADEFYQAAQQWK